MHNDYLLNMERLSQSSTVGIYCFLSMSIFSFYLFLFLLGMHSRIKGFSDQTATNDELSYSNFGTTRVVAEASVEDDDDDIVLERIIVHTNENAAMNRIRNCSGMNSKLITCTGIQKAQYLKSKS